MTSLGGQFSAKRLGDSPFTIRTEGTDKCLVVSACFPVFQSVFPIWCKCYALAFVSQSFLSQNAQNKAQFQQVMKDKSTWLEKEDLWSGRTVRWRGHRVARRVSVWSKSKTSRWWSILCGTYEFLSCHFRALYIDGKPYFLFGTDSLVLCLYDVWEYM